MTAAPFATARRATSPGLRPYQVEATEAVFAYWSAPNPGKGAMLVMATGTGKTATALSICVEEAAAGGRVIWLAHRRELLDQPYRTLCRWWPHLATEAGIVQAGRDASHARIVFASVDTLRNARRARALLAHGAPTLVVVDEAHHAPSATHRKVLEALTGPNTRLLALTATPDREDGADLSEQWEIVYSYDILRAVDEGWLTIPYAAVARLPGLDLSGVQVRRDYDDAELGRQLLMQGIVQHTVDVLERSHLCYRLPDRDASAYLRARHSGDGRARGVLVFTASVEQAERTAEALSAAGWRARAVSGETPTADRSRLLAAFGRGQVEVLCNAAVLTEGTDLPRASAVVLARPTRSWSLYVQMVGRALRLYDEEWDPANGACNRLHPAYAGDIDGLILDLAGATEEHSLVAAPVLIGGDRCAESPNGVHEFATDGAEPAGAVCTHCGKKRSCWAALQAGLEGHHVYTDDDPDMRRCRYCERVQCPHADDGRHKWMPVDEGRQSECMWCEHRIPDPHAALVGAQSRFRPVEECAGLENWMRLSGLVPETFAVVVPDEGILYVSGERCGPGAWLPHWLPHRARKARPLSLTPIPTATVRAWADDIVRRAARAKRGSDFGRITDRQREYAERLRVDADACGSSAELGREIDRARARERALATGIAAEAP